MAFSYTVTQIVPGTGPKARAYGTYTNTLGSTGGDIVTNLFAVERLSLQPTGASVIATQSVVNETFPVYKNSSNPTAAITIVTSANESGLLEAWGV